ncbi:MAG: CBS domain-containing protein [Methanoregulaceae archaeon]|nr:CBS domain-containing protein [Methanoregulaceae archaeon]
MNGSFRIGSLFGIPIRIHWTFLVIIPFFAWIIGSQIGPTTDLIAGFYNTLLSSAHPVVVDTSIITDGWMPYILGTVIALGLFGGVLVHEIAHSLVAMRNGIRINSITLLVFGGVSSIEDTTPDPVVELPMALAGPVTSFLVGLVTSGLVYVADIAIQDRAVAGVYVFIFGYLGLLNIILFVFNMLPAFPMDGGRVLRALLARRMPLVRATRIAANVGRVFAVIFGIVGLLLFNPILILIAFFIYLGAGQEANAAKYSYLLRDVTLGDMMSRPVDTVPPNQPVREVVTRMYSTKHLGFPVVDRGVLVGMITVADVQALAPLDREAMQVRDIMTREVTTLPPTAPVMEALRIMSARNIGRIPVVQGGELVGIVTRTDILKVIELRGI